MDNDHGPGTDICCSRMCEGVLPVPGACIKGPPFAILKDLWNDRPVISIRIEQSTSSQFLIPAITGIMPFFDHILYSFSNKPSAVVIKV